MWLYNLHIRQHQLLEEGQGKDVMQMLIGQKSSVVNLQYKETER